MEKYLSKIFSLGKKSVFEAIFRTLSDGSKREFLAMDASLVQAHQHASGAPKEKS